MSTEPAADGPRPPQLAYAIPDAAAQLGVGRTTIYGLIDAGEIQTIHIGRRRVVPRSSLEAYLERRLDGAA